MAKKVEKVEAQDNKQLVYLKVEELYPHPDNPRKDLGELSELAESIKAKGILQNLTVVPGHKLTDDELKTLNKQYDKDPSEELRDKINRMQSSDGYTVIIGHRRLAAAKIAGLTELPCVIAEMSPEDQIATMIMENVQRNALTYLEQAKAFQMLMDLGQSVSNIVEKTGFSDSTVRRRIKLLEFPEDELIKAEGRGATLFDFAKIEEIEDPEAKNKLLKSIGTANFDYDFQRFKDEQRRKKRQSIWEKALEEAGLIKIDYNEMFKTNSPYYRDDIDNNIFYLTDDPKEKIGKLYKNKQYYYAFSYLYFYIRLKGDKSEFKKKKEEDKRENAEKKQKMAALKEACERCIALHTEFFENMKPSHAVKLLHVAVYYFAICNAYYLDPVDDDSLYELAGMDPSRLDEEDADEDALEKERNDKLREIISQRPENTLFILLDSCFGIRPDHYFTWSGFFANNSTLAIYYSMLDECGYECSDEEKALRDGTSELYINS